MQIMGIDPSKSSGTGVAIIQTGALPRVIYEDCFKPRGDLGDDDVLEAWIVERLVNEALPRLHETGIIGLEWPPPAVRATMYRVRGTGEMRPRALVSPSQWRLVGRMMEALRGRKVYKIRPMDAKKAAGLPPRSKSKPVEEIRKLLGHKITGFKYRREAIADAIAIALATDARRKLPDDFC